MLSTQQLQSFQIARHTRDPRFDGLFYVGVKTTGIFCRPVCPAKIPNEKNVTYFTQRESAMLSGFRPCLRCRPDSAPGSPAWKGAGTTVERALQLVVSHPRTPLTQIASKLGISSRYLHQLLKRAVNMGPKQFRLYSQILNAKQLLHESSLSVEDVAQSVGFSSSRRLQAKLKEITGFTPSQMRHYNATSQRSGMTIFLRYRPPYDWPGIRTFLACRALTPIERVTKHDYQRHFIMPTGDKGWFKAAHNPTDNGFDVTIELERYDHLLDVIRKIKRLLDLDANPMAIEQGLLASGLEQQQITPGIRVPGVWTPFEAGCRAIIGQQISVTAAIKQLHAVSESLNGKRPMCFPTPEQIASVKDAILRMPSARKQALRQFAQCYREEQTPSVEKLLSIKGIGPWTVNYIQMRGFADPDVFLASDLIVARMQKQYNLTPAKASPWGSYLTLQLWQLANQE